MGSGDPMSPPARFQPAAVVMRKPGVPFQTGPRSAANETKIICFVAYLDDRAPRDLDRSTAPCGEFATDATDTLDHASG